MLVDESAFKPIIILSNYLINQSTNDPINHSKYLGVQCRQLWVHTTGRSTVVGGLGAKYEECQRKHFTDYIESAANLTRSVIR